MSPVKLEAKKPVRPKDLPAPGLPRTVRMAFDPMTEPR